MSVFDVLGVADFLRARYGDALLEDLAEANVKNTHGDFTVIELKLIITRPNAKEASHDQAPCACGNEGCTGG